VGRSLPELERALRSRGLEHRLVTVTSPGQAARAARDALASGGRFVVAVGDDATVHGVVNGLLRDDRPVAPESVLGVVPAGAECDFARTFGLPGDVARATGHLEGDRLYPIDVGKATVAAPGGAAVTRYFAGVAEVGLGADVVRRAARLPAGVERVRRFLAFWLAVAAFRPGRVSVSGARSPYEGPAHNVVVANGQYGGGGLRISPRSWPGDGLLEVLVMTGPRSDAFTMLPRLYRGEHLPDPRIVELKARRVEVRPDRPWPVHADGQLLGRAPATFEVLRQPVRLKV
jgi:YegS/Rv2252/BmrU family lipid kinase